MKAESVASAGWDEAYRLSAHIGHQSVQVRNMRLALEHLSTLLRQLLAHEVRDIHQMPVFLSPAAHQIIRLTIDEAERAMASVVDDLDVLNGSESNG